MRGLGKPLQGGIGSVRRVEPATTVKTGFLSRASLASFSSRAGVLSFDSSMKLQLLVLAAARTLASASFCAVAQNFKPSTCALQAQQSETMGGIVSLITGVDSTKYVGSAGGGTEAGFVRASDTK